MGVEDTQGELVGAAREGVCVKASWEADMHKQETKGI